MNDIDEQVVDETEAAFDALNRRYARATPAEQWDLEPQIEMALQKYIKARIKLLKAGTIATVGDLEEMRRIKAEIENAATQQELLIAAARVIGFIARFAV